MQLSFKINFLRKLLLKGGKRLESSIVGLPPISRSLDTQHSNLQLFIGYNLPKDHEKGWKSMQLFSISVFFLYCCWT